VNLGDLVSALDSYNGLSHALLLASALNSPVKGKSSVLKMVLSLLADASPEVISRSFDDPGKLHCLPPSTLTDLVCDVQFLFMMGERRLIVMDFVSRTRNLKPFRCGPFIKGAAMSRLHWGLLFLLLIHSPHIVALMVPFCAPI